MAENNEKSTLTLLTLSIDECLGCKDVNVQFTPEDTSHLVVYRLDETVEIDPKVSPIMITPVGNALQLMCSMEFPDAESLKRMPQLQIGKGCIKMSFTLERLGGIDANYDPDTDGELDLGPSTSRQAEKKRMRRAVRRKERRAKLMLMYEVNVRRRFDNVEQLDRIQFRVNTGLWRDVTVQEYHDVFFVRQTNKYETLNKTLSQGFATNWLKFIQADTQNYSTFCADGNPFDTFAKLFDRRDSEIGYNLQRVATNCLTITRTTRLTERHFLLRIFKLARAIFDYITVYEYTVWFFVERINSYTALENMTVDDVELSNVRTCIKLTRDESNSFWQRSDHNITDILLVSLQMALAKASKQTVLFLGQLEKLSEFVCMQYVTAFFMNSIYSDENHNTNDNTPTNLWICRRYVQRIFEMADTMGLMVILEYPSTLTLLPRNHRFVHCKQQRDEATGAITWSVFVDETRTVDNNIVLLRDAVNLNEA